MTYRHPMRDVEIHVFQRLNPNGKGCAFVAKFHPYKAYPIFFHGQTEEAAFNAADEFRRDAVEKNEATYIKRQEALEKARAKRKAKAEADQ